MKFQPTSILFVFLGIGLIAATPGCEFYQIGANIDAQDTGDQFGYSVSAYGNRVAIGAISGDGNSINSGYVQIYELNETSLSWEQLGATINGQDSDDFFGHSVSLFQNRVAIGATFSNMNGVVQIYELNGSSWMQLGSDIVGEFGSDRSGSSVSLYENRVAIGAPENDGGGPGSGHVRVYEFDSMAWNQIGQDIDGFGTSSRSGSSVSLYQDRVAIGASFNNSNAGYVRVYEFNGTSSLWQKLGDDIIGSPTANRLGSSVSLYGDLLAAGAPTTGTGYARVYSLNGSSWTQIDGDIAGDSDADGFGWSVSLYGSSVAIGAPFGTNGYVRVYAIGESALTQLGTDVADDVLVGTPGYSVSLFENRVAIGDSSVEMSGNVRVFDYLCICGNDILEPGEECDFGTNNSNYGDCTENCTLSQCGDGWLNKLGPNRTEECDSEDPACQNCQIEIQCTVDHYSQSDCSGEIVATDAVLPGACINGNGTCYAFQSYSITLDPNSFIVYTDSACMDVSVSSMFVLGQCFPHSDNCDFGTSDSIVQCSSVCGDGYKTGNEECDDGNPLAGDGCDACLIECGLACQILGTPCEQNSDCPVQAIGCQDFGDFGWCEYGPSDPMLGCPVGTVDIEGQCVTGIDTCDDPCPDVFWTCTAEACTPVCSDGEMNGNEECDDGNIFPGDGCDMMCQLENKTPTVSRFLNV